MALTTPMPEYRSVYSVPSVAVTVAPRALSTVIGSTPASALVFT
jgi:hypothetical protein